MVLETQWNERVAIARANSGGRRFESGATDCRHDWPSIVSCNNSSTSRRATRGRFMTNSHAANTVSLHLVRPLRAAVAPFSWKRSLQNCRVDYAVHLHADDQTE